MTKLRSYVILLIILCFGSAHGFWNYRFWTGFYQPRVNQCKLESPELGVYDHTFVFVMDGIFNGFDQNLEQFLRHQKCAGRPDNQSIMEVGRKAVEFFTEYGFDMSPVTDDDLIDGRVQIEGGKLLFHPFCLSTNTKFRIILEADCRGSRFYRSASLYDFGWALDILQDITITSPKFTGTVLAGGHIVYADYLSLTGLESGSDEKVLIHYETKDPNTFAGNSFYVSGLRVYSDIYGEGQSYGLYENDQATGSINGREVLTFPRKK